VAWKRNTLADLLGEAGVDEDQVRWDYSGRGMYGRTCFGFTGNQRNLVAFALGLGYESRAQEDDPSEEVEFTQGDAISFLAAVRTDSMGLDTIFYFPGVEVEQED
jgi:hypothetical protein